MTLPTVAFDMLIRKSKIEIMPAGGALVEVRVSLVVPSVDDRRDILVQQNRIVPWTGDARDGEYLRRAIRDTARELLLHELDEQLMVDGRHVVAPVHHR